MSNKKEIKPSDANAYDLISQISITVKDDKVGDPCKFKLRVTTYVMDYTKGIVVPDRFEVVTTGKCRSKMSPYVDILNKIGKFIKRSVGINKRNMSQRRREAIAVMITAYKENPDMFDLRIKVIPVRGNRADYEQINNFFGLSAPVRNK